MENNPNIGNIRHSGKKYRRKMNQAAVNSRWAKQHCEAVCEVNEHRIGADDILDSTRLEQGESRSQPVVAARRKIDLMGKLATLEPPSSTASTSALPSSDQPQTADTFPSSPNPSQADIDTGTVQPESTGRCWALVNVDQLNLLLQGVSCSECLSDGSLVMREGAAPAQGFAQALHLECKQCPYKSAVIYSSPRVGNSLRGDVPFEINPLMTMLVHELGKGHSALQKIASVLGLSSMNEKTYRAHKKKVQLACHDVTFSNLQSAAEAVRESHHDLGDDDGIIDLTVSYDGTWQKRGFTSKHGVGVIIEVQTGLILDFEVLSKYCQACALAENKFGKGTPAFQAWLDQHTDCDCNFNGSSKAMEPEAAKRMFGRSMEKHLFRYVNVVCDGDSSTFCQLQRENPYGEDHPLTKMDCVNHADKRMGTSLRKLLQLRKLGGKGQGRLTNAKASKLQAYYGRAIRRNRGDPRAMKDAIWATLFHSMSTDEDPHHQRCPAGEDSWCIFNKATAFGLPQPAHDGTSISTFLSREVAEHLIPIYERMTDENLLDRMTTGATQNANECINNLIWVYCPKTVFVGHKKLLSSVQIAVTRFNAGATATSERMRCLGTEPTEAQMACMRREDEERMKKADRKSNIRDIDARRQRQVANRQAIADLEALEEPQYGAGNF